LTLHPQIEVKSAGPEEVAGSLKLLEEFLRGGDPVPLPLTEQLKGAIERGDLEVLVARRGWIVGIAVVTYRPSVSSGRLFASIEDLCVKPEARHRGVGGALVKAIGERCKERSVSYIEVQTDDEAAGFYQAVGYELEPEVRVLSRSYAL
jgi:ribosomal protein S18 acetylase RimI-like enzyme